MIVVMALQVWKDCALAGIELGMGKSLGFLPVYETLEDARVDFPTAPVKAIRAKKAALDEPAG